MTKLVAMVLNEDPVTLIIKDPTLQIDKTVECGMSWTIERLKNHIYDVYPNKPVSKFMSLKLLGLN